jgi:hypothetical protein
VECSPPLKKPIAVIAFAFVLFVACARPPSGDAQPAKTATNSQDDSSTTLSNIKAAAIGVHMKFTDPQTGKLLWTADVQRIEGISPAGQNEAQAVLHVVHGVLYQNSAPADHITAPIVHVDNATKIVIASGGVTVVSITQKGTSLTCDTVTYYAGTGHLIGVGHVVFHKAGFTQTSPSFAGDVKLKSVVMPAPGIGSGGGAVDTQLKF